MNSMLQVSVLALAFATQVPPTLQVSRGPSADIGRLRNTEQTGVRESAKAQSLQQRLEDRDPDVRFLAISEMSRLAMQAGHNGSAQEKLVTEWGTFQPLLLDLLDDPDFRVRGGAARMLGFAGHWPSQQLTARLVDRYSLEMEPGVRAVIVNVLAQRAIDVAEVQKLTTDALQDSAVDVRRNAAQAVSRFHSPAALSRIVAELSSGNEATRPEFVQALASYGPAAKVHVNVLENLLTVESNSERREQIRRAIAALNGKQ